MLAQWAYTTIGGFMALIYRWGYGVLLGIERNIRNRVSQIHCTKGMDRIGNILFNLHGAQLEDAGISVMLVTCLNRNAGEVYSSLERA